MPNFLTGLDAALCQPCGICLLFVFLMPFTRRLSFLIGRDALESKLLRVYTQLLMTKTEDVILSQQLKGLHIAHTQTGSQ